jgi:hypothetical protein
VREEAVFRPTALVVTVRPVETLMLLCAALLLITKQANHTQLLINGISGMWDSGVIRDLKATFRKADSPVVASKGVDYATILTLVSRPRIW